MAPNGGGIHHQQRLVGEGAYEGLFALQACDFSATTARSECEGAVFRGDIPETPAEAPDRPHAG